jgi:hypothetical protein
VRAGFSLQISAHTMASSSQPSIKALNHYESVKLQAMEAIARSCQCFEGAVIFGGYVRDLSINHVLPNDLDMCFKSRSDALAFLRLLSESYAVDMVEDHAGYSWGKRRFESYKARIGAYGPDGKVVHFTVDILCGSRDDLATTICDFSCNLLVLSRTALEMVSVPPCWRYRSSPILEALTEIGAKQFRLVGGKVSLLKNETGPYASKLCRRASTMVQRGWEMLPGDSFVAYGFRPSVPRGATECAICKADLEENEAITETICKHTFHCSCISTWLCEGRSEITCPVCREPNFMLPASHINIILNEKRRPAEAEEDDDEYDDDDDDDDDDEDFEIENVQITLDASNRRRTT